MQRATAFVAVLAATGALARAGAVIEQWGPDQKCAHPAALSVVPAARAGDKSAPAGPWVIRIDLRGLPPGAKVHRASLLAERKPIDGGDDAALVDVAIHPLTRPHAAGGKPAIAAEPLPLAGPWFASFDVTETVRQWAARPETNHGLYVKAFPGWTPERTRLEVMYEAARTRAAGRAMGVKAFHRGGQTFITWRETEDPLGGKPPTWGNVQAAMKAMDSASRVRYLVFRHTEPISAGSIPRAKLLGRVRPLSACNVHGRSVEELVAMIRRRAIDDIALSRVLARRGLRYTPNSPEMSEVTIKRFAVEDGKPLSPGTGLYVHQPDRAGRAWYVVVASVNGTAELGQISGVSVEEAVGAGEPVRQPPADVTVFYDYPGRRIQYVQWTAPPLSNLPNQYYNWSVYVPRDPPAPTPVRIAFTKDQFIKPGVRHRNDTILISGQDRPIWSFWYGYHEALGTLKSFRRGCVRSYTKHRLFAFIDWAMKEFKGDPKRLSAVGGTDALYYGVKHGDRFAYVLADSPDPNCKLTPKLVRIDNYRRHPPRPQREAVWGKVEWKIPDETGKCVWDEFDLIACVSDPNRGLAFLSMGPAMLSAPWTSQVTFMKTLWASKHGFAARFYWGGGRHLPIPEGRAGAKDAFDFALDIPFLALRNNSNDRGLDSRQFKTGTPGYGSGGRIADGRRWLADFVDEPDRFEITIHGYGKVVYAGGGASDVTPRRTRRFKPGPGEKLRWENTPLGKGGHKPQSGEVVADENGLVTIPQVSFRGLSRLKIYKVK